MFVAFHATSFTLGKASKLVLVSLNQMVKNVGQGAASRVNVRG